MRVYLSGAMDGRTEEEAGGWRDEATQYLGQRNITTLNPMDRKFRSSDFKDDPESVLPDLVEEDKIDIEISDVLLGNYENVGAGDNTGAGTNMEILFAWERGKRVIIVAPPDLPISPWVWYHSHSIVSTMQEAYDHIIRFNNRIRK